MRDRHSNVNIQNLPATHTKKMRCFFLLCVLHFCTDHRCSMPLHTLLTDIVETCGGSSELVHILNRLGAVSSTDTHDSYVQYIVTKQLQQNEIPCLVSNGFTIASTDNLDFKQSHATVYSGDQSRSWHGTTMQLVQPKPLSLQNPHRTPTTSDHDYNATQCCFAC